MTRIMNEKKENNISVIISFSRLFFQLTLSLFLIKLSSRKTERPWDPPILKKLVPEKSGEVNAAKRDTVSFFFLIYAFL